MKPLLAMPLFAALTAFGLTASAAAAGASDAANEKQLAAFLKKWDLDGDEALSLEEATAKRKQIFEAFDQDGNGTLDSGEYDAFDAARKAGSDGTGAALGDVNDGFSRSFNDIDGDGQVSNTEFLKQSEAWFGVTDRDANGFLNPDEFSPNIVNAD